MTVKIRTTLAQAMLATIEAHVNAGGGTPRLEVRTGGPMTSGGLLDIGTLLASIDLPADWLNNASGNNVGLVATLSDAVVNNTGNAGHWTIFGGDNEIVMNGTCSGIGGGGDMIITNPSLVAGEQLNVTAFNISFSNTLL